MAAVGTVGARLAALQAGQERKGIPIRLGGEGKGESFADALKDALGEVSQLQDKAQDAIGAYLRGDPVEVHEVMAAAEEAGIALDMLIEIRNKLTEAYRSVMQMQA
ncbi:MAG: flagellar hook-basal body complex protein FliE [Gemmatimonadota bacterium]